MLYRNKIKVDTVIATYFLPISYILLTFIHLLLPCRNGSLSYAIK